MINGEFMLNPDLKGQMFIPIPYLNGHKFISILLRLTSILPLTTKLETLKHSATVAREARVQAQEVGVINLVRFSQGDTGLGYLVVVVT